MQSQRVNAVPANAVPWTAVFGNARPVEVEIGPGRGEWLLVAAAAAPETNFFAIERVTGAAGAIRAAAERRRLANVRVVAGDARCIVAHLIADASVSAYRIFFPDPWPKTRHRRRRLMSHALAADLARTLEPGGRVEAASDLAGVVAEMGQCLATAGLVAIPGAVRSASHPTTAFERKYARAGTFYACFTRRR